MVRIIAWLMGDPRPAPGSNSLFRARPKFFKYDGCVLVTYTSVVTHDVDLQNFLSAR